jgi:hypothetical protein
MIKNVFITLLAANALAVSGLLLAVFIRRLAVIWRLQRNISAGENVLQSPEVASPAWLPKTLGRDAVVFRDRQPGSYGSSGS